jgi:glycerol-3-phosphate acyltransferase PlsX
MNRIAVDAMGGDLAPAETVRGAVAASSMGLEPILVGDQSAIANELARLEADLPVVHASQVIEMGEDPGQGLRDKPDSSISVCARMVAEGQAGAMISAGSTGAAMAAAAIIIGRSQGVARPTIASVFPTPGSPTVVLDSGANIEVKPEHLVQFAVMGAVLSEVLFGLEKPRVGLLNIGEEPGKGRQLDKDAFDLLAATSLNFVGNVEGRDLATDRADVIVSDGFTGNVFLKTTEGAAQTMAILMMEAFSQLEPETQAAVLPALGEIRRRMDYETYGGAHLLGVNGVVVIAHGSSSHVAIANGIRIAHDGVARDLVGKVASRLAGA